MATYSNSRVSTFENCPYQYKLKYVDRIKVEKPTTIEAFMGDLVHRALEKLYTDKKFRKTVTKAILLKYYRDLWEKEYSDDILIVKKDLTSENYRRMGLKFISDYYDTYKPFEEMSVIGLETQSMLTLPDGNKWHVRIDKLGYEGNVYFVCDYKTNARMKLQEEADSDRQLAMYALWVKDKFKDAEKVILKWYMLAFNKEMTSERTEEELKILQEEVMKLIKKIEDAVKNDNFPRKQSALCNYCLYKEECPSFKHEYELEKKTVEEFKKDEGVQLVDEFSEIKTKLSELKKEEDKFKEKLINFGKQFEVDAVFGSNHVAKLRDFDKIVMPEDREELLELIKKRGLYEACSSLNYSILNSKILKGELEDIKKKVDIVKSTSISLSKRKDVEE